MNIDALCAAALARLSESTDARIEKFRQQSELEYHKALRSIGQKARRLREALLKGKA